MGVGVTGGGFVGVSNAAGTGGATLGVDTLNVGHLTISNEAGTARSTSGHPPVSASGHQTTSQPFRQDPATRPVCSATWATMEM